MTVYLLCQVVLGSRGEAVVQMMGEEMAPP